LVDRVEVEARGVFEDFSEVCRIPHSTAVFRRRSATSVDARGNGSRLIKTTDRLQSDDQVPGVAVVVAILQHVAGLRQRLVQPHIFCWNTVVFTLFDVVRTQEELGVAIEGTATESEAMEVGVGPAEGALQHLVEHVEPDVGPHIQASLDRRLGVLKINAYAKERRLAPARLPE
jgi:hypothetical protein